MDEAWVEMLEEAPSGASSNGYVTHNQKKAEKLKKTRAYARNEKSASLHVSRIIPSC